MITDINRLPSPRDVSSIYVDYSGRRRALVVTFNLCRGGRAVTVDPSILTPSSRIDWFRSDGPLAAFFRKIDIHVTAKAAEQLPALESGKGEPVVRTLQGWALPKAGPGTA